VAELVGHSVEHGEVRNDGTSGYFRLGFWPHARERAVEGKEESGRARVCLGGERGACRPPGAGGEDLGAGGERDNDTQVLPPS
jgi:hypothetical protein